MIFAYMWFELFLHLFVNLEQVIDEARFVCENVHILFL